MQERGGKERERGDPEREREREKESVGVKYALLGLPSGVTLNPHDGKGDSQIALLD